MMTRKSWLMSSGSASTGSDLQSVRRKSVKLPTICASAFLPVGSGFPPRRWEFPSESQSSLAAFLISSHPQLLSKWALPEQPPLPSTDITVFLSTHRAFVGVRPCTGNALACVCLQLFSSPCKALTDCVDLWTVAMVKLPTLWRKGVPFKNPRLLTSKEHS